MTPQNMPSFFDLENLRAMMAQLGGAQQGIPGAQQQMPITATTQPMAQVPVQTPAQGQPVPPTQPAVRPIRGTAGNPMIWDQLFGEGASEKGLAISSVLGNLAQAIGGQQPGIWGSLARGGGAMGGMARGEMASRTSAEAAAEQRRFNQQMLDLYQALLRSRVR